MSGTSGIDVEVSEWMIAFQHDGRKMVSHPVRETKKQGDNIVVTTRQFMAGRAVFAIELLKDGHLPYRIVRSLNGGFSLRHIRTHAVPANLKARSALLEVQK